MQPLRYLLFFASLMLSEPGWAATTLVQSACNNLADRFVGGTTYSYSYPGAVTSGNLLVLGIATETRTVSSVATGGGSTYSINGANSSWGGGNLSQWKAIASAADTAVTITVSGTENNAWVCFAEFSEPNSDQSGSTANGASPAATTTHGSGSVTPPTANNIIVATSYRSNRTWTEDGAFTSITTGSALQYFGYIIQSAATAQSLDMVSDTNGDSAIRIGAFAGSAAAANTSRFRLRVQP